MSVIKLIALVMLTVLASETVLQAQEKSDSVDGGLDAEPIQAYRIDSRVARGQLSNSGDHFAAGGHSANFWLFDINAPESPRTLVQQETWFLEELVHLLRFSPSDSRLLSADTTGLAKVWDVETSKELAQFDHDEGWIIGASFLTGDAKVLTWTQLGKAYLWSVSDGELLREFPHGNGPVSARLNRNESRLITWSDNGFVRVWDLTSNDGPLNLSHNHAINHLVLSEDERYILTSAKDSTLTLFDFETGRRLNRFKTVSNVHRCFLTQDNSAAVGWCDDGAIRLWSLSDGDLKVEHRPERGISNVFVAETHPWVVICRRDKKAEIRSTQDFNLLATLDHDGEVWGAQFLANESRLLTRSRDGVVRLWIVPDGKLLSTYRHGEVVVRMQLNDDESRLLTLSHEMAKVWEVPRQD